MTACKEKNSINQPVTSEEEKDTVPVLMTGEGEMPTTWIDKTTGHQLKKLTSEGNNRSFYFHNNPLDMKSAKRIEDRYNILNKSKLIIFNSFWTLKQFKKNLSLNQYIHQQSKHFLALKSLGMYFGPKN